MKFTRTDHMQLLPHMQDVGSEIMDEILKERANYKPEIYTEADVKAALNAKHCSLENLKALLSPAAAPFLELNFKGKFKKSFSQITSTKFAFTALSLEP